MRGGAFRRRLNRASEPNAVIRVLQLMAHFENNQPRVGCALPQCREIAILAWIVLEVETMRVWRYQPALHFGFPEIEAIAFRYPSERLPQIGNHEGRTVAQKLHDIR